MCLHQLAAVLVTSPCSADHMYPLQSQFALMGNYIFDYGTGMPAANNAAGMPTGKQHVAVWLLALTSLALPGKIVAMSASSNGLLATIPGPGISLNSGQRLCMHFAAESVPVLPATEERKKQGS